MVDPSIATIALVSIVALTAIKAGGSEQNQTLLAALIELIKRLGK